MPEENEPRTFILKFNEGTDFEEVSDVEIWIDGREYDPDREGYRPRYSYKITSEDWEYIDNDIRGVVNEPPDLGVGARALFGYLYACQDGMPYTEDQASQHEHHNLFPVHVREWAYNHSEIISSLYDELVTETIS